MATKSHPSELTPLASWTITYISVVKGQEHETEDWQEEVVEGPVDEVCGEPDHQQPGARPEE